MILSPLEPKSQGLGLGFGDMEPGGRFRYVPGPYNWEYPKNPKP